MQDDKEREVVVPYTVNVENGKRERAPRELQSGCTHSIVPKATWWT